jgi:hypothetical protein
LYIALHCMIIRLTQSNMEVLSACILSCTPPGSHSASQLLFQTCILPLFFIDWDVGCRVSEGRPWKLSSGFRSFYHFL